MERENQGQNHQGKDRGRQKPDSSEILEAVKQDGAADGLSLEWVVDRINLEFGGHK